MRLVVALCLVAACVPAPNARVQRWPTHRKDRDARIEKLEHEQAVLIEHVARLEKALAALRGDPPAADQDAPPPAPTSAAAPTSTSGTP